MHHEQLEAAEHRPSLDNASVADAAERVAVLLEAEGNTVERVRPWRRAARAIGVCPRLITERVAEEGVEALHQLGIDYVVGGLLTDFVRSGRLPLLERLEARSAGGNVFQRVPGIGPKLARELRQVLGVQSLDGLARAARDGSLSRVCGFGPRRTGLVASLLAPSERSGCAEQPASQLDLWSTH